MIYDDEMLQEINDNADLLSYVQQTMDLEQRGSDYFAHCPLHVDLTPSLSFTPEKNSYYCFSCGRSGGMIGYLIDYEGMDFEDAVEKAARLSNIDLNKMCQSKTVSMLKKYRALNRSLKERTQFTHDIIPDSVYAKYKDEPIEEWESEGISKDVMRLFGVKIDDIANRIIYPVFDLGGRLINIKGRTRYGNYKTLKLPKYINYFKVGVVDYFQGLNVTIDEVQKSGEIFVFESIKSVMKAYGWGYKNCASAEKHTLTPEQIDLLIRLKVNVVLAYDSDISYRRDEVKRNIDILRRLTNVYVIEDREGLLGGAEAKNAPVDCGLDIWEELYSRKKKVV